MAETTTSPSPCGRWELRYTNDYAVNSAGYGNGGWRYELVDRKSGAVLTAWTGAAHTSPWDSWSMGVSSVRWEGTRLIITTDDGSTEVDPEPLSQSGLPPGS